jgi:hypothetical protein
LEEHQAPISFFNYEGPQARIETREQIWNIGYALGQAVRGGNNSPGTRDRYFAVHVANPEEGKLDADIFGLGYDTGVDHIRNLRLILQGYLEGAYEYGAQDAALLAEYVTIYNAVYRGNWDYINSRYKDPVVAGLNPEQAGLSIRFDEWPGRTLMMIPLGRGGAGSLSALDTSVVADSRVVEELQKDEDRGVEQRRDMVDLKEREAEEAEQLAQEQRREADEEQRQIDEDRRQLEEDRRLLEEGGGQAAPDRSQTGEEGTEQPPADQASAGPGPEAEELDRREEELDRRQEAVDQTREDAQRNEEFADQKREEAREERESIAADQQVLIDQGSPREAEGMVALLLNGPDSSLGRFVRIAQDGTELWRSPINTVNVRTVCEINGRLIAIAGEDRGSGAIRLIEVDSGTLELSAQGDDDIHPQSPLWVNGADLYAITVAEGDAYLGRFDVELERQARSAGPIHPLGALLFRDGLIFTQRPNGSALILDARTLREP